MKVTQRDENTVFVSSRHPKVKEWLQFSVKPVTHRYFDESAQAWVLNREHLVAAVRIGTYYTGRVDYSDLDIPTQMEIAAQKAAWRTRSRLVEPQQEEDPYRVMHLLPTAPQAIIDATYKALAKLHHPDMGGDAEEFKRVTDAYQRIKARNNAH